MTEIILSDIMFTILYYLAAVILITWVVISTFWYRNYRWKKKKLSADFVERWNTSFPPFRTEVLQRVQEIEPEQLIDRTDESIRRILHEWLSIMSFYEEMSMAILEGLADEQYLRAYFQSSFLFTYKLSRKHLDFLRTRTFQPDVYHYSEILTHKWERSSNLARGQ